jgi:hypothetical protein
MTCLSLTLASLHVILTLMSVTPSIWSEYEFSARYIGLATILTCFRLVWGIVVGCTLLTSHCYMYRFCNLFKLKILMSFVEKKVTQIFTCMSVVF